MSLHILKKMERDYLSCSICFSLYNDESHIPKFLPCGHTFCSICIDILPKCPICSTPKSGLFSAKTNFAMLDFLKFRRVAYIPINDSNIKEMLDEISNHKSCIQILSKKLQEVISSISTFNNSVSVSLLDSLKSMFQSLKLAYSEITQLIHTNQEAVLKLNKHFEHLRKIYNSAEELQDKAQRPGNDGKLQAAHAVSYFDMKNLPEFEYKVQFSFSAEKLVEDITEKLKSFSDRCEQIQIDLSISGKLKEHESIYKLKLNQENLSFSTRHGFLDKSIESFYDLNHGHADEVFQTVELNSDEPTLEISTDNPFRKYNSGVDDS